GSRGRSRPPGRCRKAQSRGCRPRAGARPNRGFPARVARPQREPAGGYCKPALPCFALPHDHRAGSEMLRTSALREHLEAWLGQLFEQRHTGERRCHRPIILSMKTRLLAADSPGAVEEAAAALFRGELVAFPTDTVYGLAAGHDHVRKLYGAKDRPKEKRIPVLLSDASNLEASAQVTPA